MDAPEEPDEDRGNGQRGSTNFKKTLDRIFNRKKKSEAEPGSGGRQNDASTSGAHPTYSEEREESDNENDTTFDHELAKFCQFSELVGMIVQQRQEENSDSGDEDNSGTDGESDSNAEEPNERHQMNKSNDVQDHFNDQQFQEIFDEEIRIGEQQISQKREMTVEMSMLDLDNLIDDIMNETIPSISGQNIPQDIPVVVNPIKQLSQIRNEERYLRRVEEIQSEIKPFECPLCLEVKPLGDSESFGCCHLVCTDCLGKFFNTKIDEGQVIDIKCPVDNCNKIAEVLLVKSLVSFNKSVRYEELLLKHAIDDMDDIVNCPKCNGSVECDLGTGEGNCIPCRYSFCTSCLKDFHGTDDCAEVQIRLEDNIRSEDLIRLNLKMCPGCKTNIEKDTIGCNHMTCAKCKTQFCWLCLDKLPTDQREFERHYSKCVLFEYNDD